MELACIPDCESLARAASSPEYQLLATPAKCLDRGAYLQLASKATPERFAELCDRYCLSHRSQPYSLARFPTSNCHRFVVAGGHMLSDPDARRVLSIRDLVRYPVPSELFRNTPAVD